MLYKPGLIFGSTCAWHFYSKGDLTAIIGNPSLFGGLAATILLGWHGGTGIRLILSVVGIGGGTILPFLGMGPCTAGFFGHRLLFLVRLILSLGLFQGFVDLLFHTLVASIHADEVSTWVLH